VDEAVEPPAPAVLTVPAAPAGAWLLMLGLGLALAGAGARALFAGAGRPGGALWGSGTSALGVGMILGGVALAVIAHRRGRMRLVLDAAAGVLAVEEPAGTVALPLASLTAVSLRTLPVAESPLALSLGLGCGGRVDLLVAGAERAAEPFAAHLEAAIERGRDRPAPATLPPFPALVARHVSGAGTSYAWSARPGPELLAALLPLGGGWLLGWPSGPEPLGVPRLVGLGLLSAATLALLGHLLWRACARHRLRIHAGMLSLAAATGPGASRRATVPTEAITAVDVTHHPAVGLGLVLRGPFAPSGLPIDRGRLPVTALVALGLGLGEQIDRERRTRDAPPRGVPATFRGGPSPGSKASKRTWQ
jgi:hypothetical protein